MTMELLLPIVVGFVVGAVLSWLFATLMKSRDVQRRELESTQRTSAAEATAQSERVRRAGLEKELEEAQQTLRELDREVAVAREREDKAKELIAELKSFAEHSKKELQDSFEALAAAALKGSSEQFLALAEQKLATTRAQSTADLEERKKAIEALLQPLKETLQKLDSKTQEIEKSRVDAYSRIDKQVEMLAAATSVLQEKTTSLAAALKGSQVRGRWGEIALRNVVELAGMTAHCDFEEQTTVGDGKRPDMTVNLPDNRIIAIDAKAPLSAYLEATETEDETARQTALDRHAKSLKGHIRALAARDYAEALGAEVDLVVMFLPGDPFLSAAFAKDPDLMVEALRLKVLLATPTTLVALLRTVAIYWQQRSLAENAETIAASARELYDRAAKFSEDLARIGKGLGTALQAYNAAVGSFDRRLMPMSRQLEEMKVSEQTKRKLEAPEPVDDEPRRIGGA
ncbi:MAG: DNA recombination protein RmuC [Acidobacteria bacterium]|nr:MAG: DNA recombination protein RmuC [Acidobacteriota bacterium]